jgi:hypothetical protein
MGGTLALKLVSSGEPLDYFGCFALRNHDAFLNVLIPQCVPTSRFLSSYCFCCIFSNHKKRADIQFGFFSKIYDFLTGALTQNC